MGLSGLSLGFGAGDILGPGQREGLAGFRGIPKITCVSEFQPQAELYHAFPAHGVDPFAKIATPEVDAQCAVCRGNAEVRVVEEVESLPAKLRP